jgi:HSP20 family protein
MRMVRWNPTAACNTVATRSMNNDPFFGLMNNFLSRENEENSLDVDIFEQDDSYVLTAELPGVKKDDLTVNLEGDVLTLEAEKRSEFAENKENAYHAERSYGKFSRSFRLNGQVEGDKIEADYTDGILRLTMPKREEVKGRAITVK